MNHNYSAEYMNILIRPLMHEDIEYLRVWRNDSNSTRFLRPIGYITEQMQEDWFSSYVNNPNEITFAIVETENLRRTVGSVSIYDIKNSNAEFGKILIGDPEAHGKGIGLVSTVLALMIAFEELNLKKITAEVHTENFAAKKIYSRVGFKVVGQQQSVVGTEDILEITRMDLINSNDFIKQIKII